ncbi:hypothetical protein IAU60_003088 [Kwoniella sp. DSM 27419]
MPVPAFLAGLHDFHLDDDDALANLPAILDHQAAEQSLGGVRFSADWLQCRNKIDALLSLKTDDTLLHALRIFAKVIDTLDLYAPALKGLNDVHAYACETLERIVFDEPERDQRIQAAAFLYGQAMTMNSVTAEAVGVAIENLIIRGDQLAANLALCIILGVERSSSILFETHLPVLLRQVQMAAFGSQDKSIAQEALSRALKIYIPSEKAASCQLILQSTHSLLAASLRLCEVRGKEQVGVTWCCFIIEHTPMLLRNDLRARYPDTCCPQPIFELLLPLAPTLPAPCQASLCSALPILITWDTLNIVKSDLIDRMVRYLLSSRDSLNIPAMQGLGQIAGVILHLSRFETYLDETAEVAMAVLKHESELKDQRAAQKLLSRLLASLGPVTTDVMVDYLRLPHEILLADIGLLEMIATLLPNLAGRIIRILTDVIDDILSSKECSYPAEAVLEALDAFPLMGKDLVLRARKLVLWSLDEDRGKKVVIAGLQLATNPAIGSCGSIRDLSFRAAQLLLADDAHIVHVALSVLANPALASNLDERSCSMIFLALHQSLEPSIQIEAAKLLTHLISAHRAIVQPMAWSHIRQSLSLMDFLHSVDPTRAIVEACVISNLLPALPPSLHRKYVGPVKKLIMSGLHRPTEPHTLSLIFQGVSNLAKFEGYTSTQQTELVQELLDMVQEIPKDCQHAALSAISSLLRVPQEGLDVYELLIKVHAIFGEGRGVALNNDLKALVDGVYGHLGTVERNPVISRDSKAAIKREISTYPLDIKHLSRIAEVRDRSGPLSQTHINHLLTENLTAALASSSKASDDRALIIETMTCLSILQPQAVPRLIKDLPALIMRELRYALKARDNVRDTNSTSVSAGLLFLSAAMHGSPTWMEGYWDETAEMMAECITVGEALPTLRGLDVILDGLSD